MKECVGNPKIPVFYFNKLSIHAHSCLRVPFGNLSIHVHYYLDGGRVIELSCHLANLYFLRYFICTKLPWAFYMSFVIFIFPLWWMRVLTTYTQYANKPPQPI